MSSNCPVPKPRTRFNVGAGVESYPNTTNESESNVNASELAIFLPEGNTSSHLETVDLIPPCYASTAPSIRPRELTSEMKALCGSHTNYNSCVLSTLSSSASSEQERSKQKTSEMSSCSSVGTCQPSGTENPSCDIEYIENPIYMSLFSFRKMLDHNHTEMADVSNVIRKDFSNILDNGVCGEIRHDKSNFVKHKEHTQQFSCLPDSTRGFLERNIPVDTRVLSPRVGDLDQRYIPSPQRSFPTNTDSSGGNSVLLDEFEKVVEIAEDNIYDENCSGDEINNTAVAYFGDVLLHIGKKDKRKAHARLRDTKLSFHEDDSSEECISGPFSMLECELVHREEQIVTIKFSEKELCKTVVFSAENDAETWTLLLGECWLSEYGLLRSNIKEATAFGTFWLRQGTTGEWMYAAAVLSVRTLFYILLESSDYIYEMDIRKVILLRERVDKADWCLKCKKRDQKGPFLISSEGCALYVECYDDTSTKKWYSAIQDVLSAPSTVLENCRLTADNVPILVDKCLRFVAVYGIHSEGIYRRNGKKSEANDIYKRLIEDPVQTHIASTSEETVYAVADVLRQFFRRLKSPIFPPRIHQEIFKCVQSRTSVDNTLRYQEYRRILQHVPVVHYHTLRKLIAHLSEVVKYSDVNKASAENLARMFGPSLFNTNNDENACFDDTNDQIGAIIDLISGYDTIFEVTSREEICRAMIEQAQKTKAVNSNVTRADGLLVPIHVWQRENEPFNVKIDLAAEEVCRKAIARRGFDAPVDGNYAIFEVILDEALSRRLLPFEKLSHAVIDHWLTWKCTDGYFLFDHDNWPYNNSELDFFSGKVRIAEPGSKSFHSYEIRAENGIKLAAYKHEKLWKEWDVTKSIFYCGSIRNRKAPHPYNVTVLDKHAVCITDKFIGYCISFRLLPERTRFLNMAQFIETGGQPPPLLHL